MEGSQKRGHSALPMVYMARKKSQLDCTVYIILDGMANTFLSMVLMFELGELPCDFPEMTVDNSFKSVQSMFLRKKELKAEEERCLWTPIFHDGPGKLDRREMHSGIARCSMTKVC